MATINAADHLGLARARALRHGADRAALLDAEEYGEGSLALVRAARDFDPTRGVRFSTYAVRAIDNTIRRWRGWRKGRGGDRIPRPMPQVSQLDWPTADGPAVADHRGDGQAAVDRADLCRRALAALDDGQRRVVAGVYLEGRRYADVAAELGLTAQQMRRAVRLAVRAMRRALGVAA